MNSHRVLRQVSCCWLCSWVFLLQELGSLGTLGTWAPYLVGSKIDFVFFSHTPFRVVPALGFAYRILEGGTVSLFSLIVVSPVPRENIAGNE